MNCPSCGTLLPGQAYACPNCGTYVGSYSVSNPSAAMYEEQIPTAISDKTPAISNRSPQMAQVSQTYPSHTVNPYEIVSNPYSSVTTLASPPIESKKSSQRFRLIGIVLLCLLLVGGGVLGGWYILNQQNSPATTTTSGPTVQLSEDEAQQLYNQTISMNTVLNDPLSGPTSYGWDNYDTDHTICDFRDGAYYSKADPGYFSPCYAKATNYTHFLVEVEMTILSGHNGGLVVRADSTNDESYMFRISTDGVYILNKFYLDQENKAAITTLASGNSELIQTGDQQTNTLAVLAKGEHLYLFINGKYVDSATDQTYQQGTVGIYTDSDSQSVEALFRNMKVWKL